MLDKDSKTPRLTKKRKKDKNQDSRVYCKENYLKPKIYLKMKTNKNYKEQIFEK